MAVDAKSHFERNRDTYETIESDLQSVRDKFESRSGLEQKLMLFDSVTFAVLSVQAPISQLERAFRGFVKADSWDDVRDAFTSLNYGNNKFKYTKHNLKAVMGADDVIESLENGDTWTAVKQIEDRFKGVSWIKSAFVPSMLGYTKSLCIDTNVAQAVDGAVSARRYDSFESYTGAVGFVLSQFPDLSNELPPFLVQWIVFDAFRGDGVALHTEWFEHMLESPSFGHQQKLEAF